MRKSFNVNGPCYLDENYMVNLDERKRKIKRLVDNRKYFVINRARQYGKTTTLWALKQYLKEEYGEEKSITEGAKNSFLIISNIIIWIKDIC